MPQLDLIVRGGTVVHPTSLQLEDIGVADGKIVALAPGLTVSSRQEINASGLHIFPGLIDAHVHFNEPGRTHWEGFASGSRALAAGGGTTFFDMPLNAHPPTLDGKSFDQKLTAAQAGSLTDFAFWGGLVPGNLDQLTELHDRGVIGLKAFMSESGTDDFPRVADGTLREGMKCAAPLGMIVAVHAESDSMTKQLAQERLLRNQTSIGDYLDSRPLTAELDAIRRALDMAGETRCALHIVHVSCGEGVALINEASQRGVNVTCETCPHYLVLTDDDMLKLGAVAKCAPPLRPLSSQNLLWEKLQAGQITTVGSDHSPAPPEMKTASNFFKVWGGISGAQHMLPLLLTPGHLQRGLDLCAIGRLTSFNVAERFSLPSRKGCIKVGADADLALVDLKAEYEIRAEDLLCRHRFSPYVGRAVRGKVTRTILRGQTVFRDGRIVSEPRGQLLRPER